ncbi:MAG: inositol monophosphatase [Oscillospiraceae bacterium]|nr:inositol monophosphatase [Oscillospiraceae bacterium]
MQINYNEVIDLVQGVRRLILDREQAAHITVKGRADFATQVDFAVQRQLRQALSRRWPEVQFLGEEGEKHRLDWTKPVWILDPVDGTTNLIHDYRASCVSLGLWDGEQMGFGCVYNPYTEEMFSAVRGQGAVCNGAGISVSRRATLGESLFMIGTSPYRKERAQRVFDLARRLFLAGEDIRRSGSAALDLCAVACGRADGFFEFDLKPWDYAAASVILEEAGGTFTDIKGNAPVPGENLDVAASNGTIHRALLDLLGEREEII